VFQEEVQKTKVFCKGRVATHVVKSHIQKMLETYSKDKIVNFTPRLIETTCGKAYNDLSIKLWNSDAVNLLIIEREYTDDELQTDIGK
jgi:hypothetical protein